MSVAWSWDMESRWTYRTRSFNVQAGRSNEASLATSSFPVNGACVAGPPPVVIGGGGYADELPDSGPDAEVDISPRNDPKRAVGRNILAEHLSDCAGRPAMARTILLLGTVLDNMIRGPTSTS